MNIEFYKKGTLDGNKKVFYPNGTIAEESNYKLGVKNGLAKTFSDKGKLIDEHVYKNGQFNGLASYYDGNGNKLYEGTYKEGKRVGIWKFYDNNKVINEVKAANFGKELIKYEQRNAEKVSKSEEEFKKEQEKGK